MSAGTPVIVAILSGEIMELKRRIADISNAFDAACEDAYDQDCNCGWSSWLQEPIDAAVKLLADTKPSEPLTSADGKDDLLV